jgi:hypothetical protein
MHAMAFFGIIAAFIYSYYVSSTFFLIWFSLVVLYTVVFQVIYKPKFPFR